jgi:hypothetical protein
VRLATADDAGTMLSGRASPGAPGVDRVDALRHPIGLS